MYKKIIDKIKKHEKVAILGFGQEGKSTYEFIRRHLPEKKLYILDFNTYLIEDNTFLRVDDNVEYTLGKTYLDNLEVYDLIIKSPGVSLNRINTSSFIDNVTSQYGLLLEETDFKVIGITGSKGKSTTTTMMFEVVKAQNKNAMLLGNMGIMAFDRIERLNEDSILLIELAALQLEHIKASPHIGVILNLHEEHLDFFITPENYYNAKLNMFKYQNENDYSIYVSDNETLNRFITPELYKGKLVPVSLSDNNVYSETNERHILGKHNLTNILVVLKIVDILGLDQKKAITTINNFKGLEHRMEKVGTYGEITFYNDSIATIPDATINAIEALKEVDTLIIGGMDRGINYSDFIKYLNNSNVSNIICLPESGHKIAKKLKNPIVVDDLKEAVMIAKEKTAPGKICILSPAAPSYNRYKNFIAKGRHYKDLVRDNA